MEIEQREEAEKRIHEKFLAHENNLTFLVTSCIRLKLIQIFLTTFPYPSIAATT